MAYKPQLMFNMDVNNTSLYHKDAINYLSPDINASLANLSERKGLPVSDYRHKLSVQ